LLYCGFQIFFVYRFDKQKKDKQMGCILNVDAAFFLAYTSTSTTGRTAHLGEQGQA